MPLSRSERSRINCAKSRGPVTPRAMPIVPKRPQARPLLQAHHPPLLQIPRAYCQFLNALLARVAPPPTADGSSSTASPASNTVTTAPSTRRISQLLVEYNRVLHALRICRRDFPAGAPVSNPSPLAIRKSRSSSKRPKFPMWRQRPHPKTPCQINHFNPRLNFGGHDFPSRLGAWFHPGLLPSTNVNRVPVPHRREPAMLALIHHSRTFRAPRTAPGSCRTPRRFPAGQPRRPGRFNHPRGHN